MKIGIIGATGYSGEILVQILANHPQVELGVITSRSLVGTLVEDTIPFLRGKLNNLKFSLSDPTELASRSDIELYFLALPHGVATEFAVPLLDAGKKVIDLSADFRLETAEQYLEFYNNNHPAEELLGVGKYILPEISNIDYNKVRLVASPGCYPTSIIFPLFPLIKDKIISYNNIVINSFSGVSGAGKKATEKFNYCSRNESAVAYGCPKHRHLGEIEQELKNAAGENVIVQFNPHLAPMKRGIISTITVQANGSNSIEELYNCWNKKYADKQFVSLLPTGQFPDSSHVVGTNRIDMSAVFDDRTNNFVITTAIDNLMKGAGGQAVQIMNLMYGFPENSGLI